MAILDMPYLNNENVISERERLSLFLQKYTWTLISECHLR